MQCKSFILIPFLFIQNKVLNTNKFEHNTLCDKVILWFQFFRGRRSSRGNIGAFAAVSLVTFLFNTNLQIQPDCYLEIPDFGVNMQETTGEQWKKAVEPQLRKDMSQVIVAK